MIDLTSGQESRQSDKQDTNKTETIFQGKAVSNVKWDAEKSAMDENGTGQNQSTALHSKYKYHSPETNMDTNQAML